MATGISTSCRIRFLSPPESTPQKSRDRVFGVPYFACLSRSSPLRASWRLQSLRSTKRFACFALEDDGENGVLSSVARASWKEGRVGEVRRITKETNVHVKLSLDGSGTAECNTGIPFLDHMLDQLASHGLLDLFVNASGDIHIDDHHTNEDIALAVGTALHEALGDRKGIYRFGHFAAPLDEAAVEVILDLSGRPHLSCALNIPTERVGKYDTQLVEHFFQSLVNTSGMTLHIRQLAGKNSHHIIEATFKAFARALRQAIAIDKQGVGTVPSTKGVLSRS
ncbi:hypothetical protein HPP92_015702 [Vanilla planifolia]|uniref:Imidazoleglycerol-phosphate dehydratase n=1 Tax=Vanilla planifolia TaxID=51239 RepID=A0A835QDH0_VANPL|nr:hypothetical protein HPP92_015702 [Vanilla planifolia]